MSKTISRTPDCVVGPLGEPLTRQSLPPAGSIRWRPRQKAEIAAAIDGGLISFEDACDRYQLSLEELAGWQRMYLHFGMQGLRATYVQSYRRAVERKTQF